MAQIEHVEYKQGSIETTIDYIPTRVKVERLNSNKKFMIEFGNDIHGNPYIIMSDGKKIRTVHMEEQVLRKFLNVRKDLFKCTWIDAFDFMSQDKGYYEDFDYEDEQATRYGHIYGPLYN